MSTQMEIVERASDGVMLPIGSLDIYTHIVGGLAQYDETSYKGITYRRTYTWDNGSVTESKWVRQ